MNRRRLTLIEVLEPRSFKATPERSRVTRTIVQPEIDSFEEMEAKSGNTEKSVMAVRRMNAATPHAAPQLVGV
jgi:hypothetical protein